jgi:hypothetical protein
MKVPLLYVLSCLLALILGACDLQGHNTAETSSTGNQGSAKRGARSNADQRPPSVASTGCDHALPIMAAS